MATITDPEESGVEWVTLLLQTSDPLFPTGAYAHSLGLEEIVRFGLVSDERTLLAFLREQIVPSLERLELPYLRLARAAALAGDVEALREIDGEINAWKLPRELREASTQLGTRRLRMLAQIAPTPLIATFQTGHHLMVCGMQFAAVPLHAALGAYFYQTVASHCSAALKLIRIGQEGCQRVLRDVLREAPETVSRSLLVERAHAGWFNPVLEIASMRHETAWERLFIS